MPKKATDSADSKYNFVIDGYGLICTCGACPEQYDVVNIETGENIGYLRLRHGYFRADCPDVGGDTVYESDTEGDGVFEDFERMQQLKNAVAAIKKWWTETTEKAKTP